MRKVSCAVFFLLFVFPVFAFAESGVSAVVSRYCPDPAKDFFKGSIYYENGKPWVEVEVDPEFKQKVLREERKITGDIPLTPVYDLVVRIKPEFNYYCIPGWMDGAPVTEDKLPPFLHVTAAIIVGTADEPVVDPVVFSRTSQQDDQGRFIYERKMQGWTNGIASGHKLERLIDEISKGQWLSEQGVGVSTVNALIEIQKPSGGSEKIKSPVTMSTCAPIWGGGQHRIVGMYDNNIANEIVSYFDTVRKVGFAKVEPYASHQNFFSYFVDLKKAIEGSTKPITQIALEAKNAKLRTPTIAVQNNVLVKYLNESSCKNGFYLLKVGNANNSLPWGLGGIALFGASVSGALIDTEGAQLVAGSRGASDVGIVFVHEFSHTFAGLNDEYVYKAESKNVGLPLRNCSVRPFVDFSYQNKLYGNTRYEGCSFQYDVGDKSSVPNARYYRPSNQSVMNRAGDEFNVVSCGYILAAIKGGDAKSYFPECAKMDGIIKDGITAQGTFSSMFAWVGTIFSLPAPLTAQVGSAIPNSSQSSYLIVESFDPNDPWGEIIEVVPDSQTPPTSPASSIQPPPSNLGDVSDDSIFDTVSVDLKVNGSDGPIEVEKRDRIVLSWISEGAIRCRGVWSKNDIKLSGTAAGRITRPVTIKIACINADGERADDEVRVNIAE